MKTYDVIVVGTGTAGQTAAFEVADGGYSVAVVEHSSEPGGTCALHGCQSKKFFYEVTEAAAKCKHLSGKGVSQLPKARWGDILREKNKFTDPIPKDTVATIKGSGIDYYEGEAAFSGPSTLMVNGEEISGRFIILATGAEPMALPVNGAEHIITSNDFLSLKELPERIAFVGGGFISFEFAHFAARLGGVAGGVHILEAQENVLGQFDADLVEQLVAASEAEGIAIHTGMKITDIGGGENSRQVVTDSGQVFDVDLVVNGAGRRPNIYSLNLEIGGVDYTPAGIKVDTAMRTSNRAVFAVGDCAATIQLARVADMEAKAAACTILSELDGDGNCKEVNYEVVPAVLFTYPQLAKVGKTEQELQQENIRYWKSSDKELGWPTYRRVGLQHAAYKILVDENDHILGAHFLSDDSTGLVNTFAQAMRAGTTTFDLYEQSILSPYPSRLSDIPYMLSPLVE